MEQKISRNELKTIFHVGRNLRLVRCLLGEVPAEEQARVVKSQHSYGFKLSCPHRGPDAVSHLRIETGKRITFDSTATGSIITVYEGDHLAAQYLC